MKLILLPGMDGTGKLFAPLLSALPKSIEPVVVSYPVNVELTWGRLTQEVEKQCPSGEPYAVLAESFSGPVALRMGAHSALKPKAIILCASFIHNPLQNYAALFKLAIKCGCFRFQAPQFVVREFLLGANVRSEIVNQFYAAVNSVDSTVMASRAKMILDLNAEAELTSCDVPILYVRATRDRLVSVGNVEVMKELNPKMQIVEIEGPHFIVQRAPFQLVEALSSFLSSVNRN